MSIAWHDIRDHLILCSSTLKLQRNFEALLRNSEPLARFADPAALLDALHVGGRAPDEKNQLLVALVGAAQSGDTISDCALTLMLLALWPGLDAIRRRSLRRGLGDDNEVVSDVLARTTAAVRYLDLQRVNRIAATILRNVERDMIRARKRDVAREHLASSTDPEDLADAGVGGIGPAGYTMLNDALHNLLGDDALLVMRVAIEGYTQAEVGVEMGLSEAAARKRYQRAKRKLHDILDIIS